jgi:5'-nucleotidase
VIKDVGGARIKFIGTVTTDTPNLAGTLTYGEIYVAEPFGQRLVTMTLTRRQLVQALERQFCSPAASSPDQPLFLAAGDNNFSVLTAGTERVAGVLDRDALAAYLTVHPDLRQPVRNRVALR